ncbi:GcrA cell cycle regulator [Rhizobium skierniewicense]|uniref:GcrA cell cycle regulator n=1 Tax=Rhizobium skierniewicense TaxID=984260 RepID=A0A7W6G2R4_9HYPH|nr:GcrA family cell cycle regulator [Rhizobium skierniewicense]MBB3947075.1 GcrA cell cycle regulator [Rhizobium skierniewicense]
MKNRWRTLSAEARSAAIIEAHPTTIGTGAAIADALSRKFGERITRSSVISFYNRHPEKMTAVPLTGRPGREMAKDRAEASQPRPQPRRPSARLASSGMAFSSPKVKPVPAPIIVAQPVPSIPVPEPRNLRLYELDAGHCRWPMQGDRENMLFCANATHDGTSYCHFHKTASVGIGSKAERAAVPRRLTA